MQLAVLDYKAAASSKTVFLSLLHCYQCHTQPVPSNLSPVENFKETLNNKIIKLYIGYSKQGHTHTHFSHCMKTKEECEVQILNTIRIFQNSII